MTDNDWAALVRDLHDDRLALAAAERLHGTATQEDVPRLLELLEDDSFFIREAAAWPLSEIAGAAVLPELLQAYQRGFDEGHDNDGFSALLADMAETYPEDVRRVLDHLSGADDPDVRKHAFWLRAFCVVTDAP
jgi:hypothetical protein